MSGFQSCWAQGFYSLWRSKRLLVFTWYGRLGLQAPLLALRTNLAGVRHFLPDFVLYSLPDALWVYSFTFLMQSVWFRHSKSYGRTFWILLPVSLAVGAEVGQLIKVVPGTFDLKDIAGYIAAWAAATMFIRTCCTRDEVTSVDICRFVTRKLGDLQTLLAGEPAEARRERHKHVSEIRMVPQAGEGKPHYVAECRWNLLGSEQDIAGSGNFPLTQVRMVAGAATTRTCDRLHAVRVLNRLELHIYKAKCLRSTKRGRAPLTERWPDPKMCLEEGRARLQTPDDDLNGMQQNERSRLLSNA